MSFTAYFKNKLGKTSRFLSIFTFLLYNLPYMDAEWLSGRMPDSRAREHRHESSYGLHIGAVDGDSLWRCYAMTTQNHCTCYFVINRDFVFIFILLHTILNMDCAQIKFIFLNHCIFKLLYAAGFPCIKNYHKFPTYQYYNTTSNFISRGHIIIILHVRVIAMLVTKVPKLHDHCLLIFEHVRQRDWPPLH